ncbi:hypothetical protein [Pseudactinotalea sp.]|uniref:hypothetical protein n=1 Tax=Pseudactinotalea sp. TaxID=1926260 RepID=UPI003B3A278C
MTSAWQRRSGLVTSTAGRADRARGFLEGALVIAIVETEPDNPDAVVVTVATDAEDRVAVVDEDRTAVTAGPTLTELAEALAATCGQVVFDDVVAGEDEESDDPSDPFDPEIDVVSAYVPDRSVVYCRATVDELGALASAVDMPVLVAPHGEGHVVLVSDGPALSAVDWSETLKPALVVEQGAAYPAAAIIAGDSAYVHTWDLDIAVVPSEATAAAVAKDLVDSTLGVGGLTAKIVALLPEADATAVRAALETGSSGPADLIAAIGLPQVLAGYLSHGADTPDLPGAKILQPNGLGQAFARAVTDAQAQMTESVREHTEQMRERAEHVRERAEAARVRAESAFDAAETFTEEVVVPIRQSWWTPAVAALEATAGALLLRRAGKGARLGTGTTAGERVLAVGGILLLVDAVVNTAIFLAPRLKRDL